MLDTARSKAGEGELHEAEARLVADADALAKLNDWSNRLWQMRNLEEGLDEMLAAVIELMGSNKGNIQLLDLDRGVLTIVAQSGFEQSFLDFFREVSVEDPSACGRALRFGQRVVIEDIETDESYAPLRSVARAAGYRAVVSTPLVSGEGKPLGMLSTHFRSAHRPNEDSLRRLGLYARQAAGFIERCNAERAMRESEERFRLIAGAAPVMIWMSGVDKLCIYFNQPWLEFTGRSLEAEMGNGWAEGVHPEDLGQCLETYTRAFDRREPFRLVHRLRRHDGDYRWILDHGVPRFSPDGSFAGYIGSCIDITEQKLAGEAQSTVNRRLIQAHEEERTRIARELHDDINQRVALLAVKLDGLKHRLPASAAEVRREIEAASQQVMELGSDVQALSHRLHSSKLGYLGLAAAASSFCRELSDQKNVEVQFSSENVPKQLSEEISLCLFRVLQEALQNAVKHSGSQHFQVSLQGGTNEIELTVHDSGIGFDPEEAMKGHGLGLTSMRERLKLVDGGISVDSKSQCGTTIHARVPFVSEMKSVGAAE